MTLRSELVWIPVTERLPKDREWVLVGSPGEESTIAFIYERRWCCTKYSPKYWAELPEVPNVHG